MSLNLNSQKSSISSLLKSKLKIINDLESPQTYTTKIVPIKSLLYKKNNNANVKINGIINDNNPINSSLSINNNNTNFIPLNEEKSIKECNNNSTFIFTGENTSCLDNNAIIDNYLKGPQVKPAFECKSISTISNKEGNELILLKEDSFSLSSSLPSNTTATNPLKKKNNRLLSLLKKINENNSYTEIKQEREDKKYDTNKKLLKTVPHKKEKKLKRKNENKRGYKRIYFSLFIIVNICAYIYCIIKMFEPSVIELFLDNDHYGYIYKTSLLSEDRSIAMNN
jgi:hypothetical protein